MGRNLMTGVLKRRGNVDTDKEENDMKIQGEDGHRQATKRPRTDPSLTVLRRINPANTRILDF